jgi:cbb3-type cytochrome oxidase maturation protein
MLLVLIPISLLLLIVAIWMFIWAVRKGQFENLESAALDILVDEEAPSTADDKTDAD